MENANNISEGVGEVALTDGSLLHDAFPFLQFGHYSPGFCSCTQFFYPQALPDPTAGKPIPNLALSVQTS